MDNNVSYFEFWIILFITITFFILSHVTVLFMNWSYNTVALPANFLSDPLKGTGSRLSECLLIELLLSKLLF